jgi:hypothetical protein
MVAGLADRECAVCRVAGLGGLVRDGNSRSNNPTLQAYLGHRNIQHTVRYTELSPDRFKDFWR